MEEEGRGRADEVRPLSVHRTQKRLGHRRKGGDFITRERTPLLLSRTLYALLLLLPSSLLKFSCGMCRYTYDRAPSCNCALITRTMAHARRSRSSRRRRRWFSWRKSLLQWLLLLPGLLVDTMTFVIVYCALVLGGLKSIQRVYCYMQCGNGRRGPINFRY